MTSRRSIFLATVIWPLLLAVLVALTPSPTRAAQANGAVSRKDKSVTKAQSLAQGRYHILEYSRPLAGDRANWLRYATALERVYTIDPRHPSAPNTLFRRGELFLKIYKKFADKEDLTKALACFEEMATRFPQHELADDALYQSARLQADELKDTKTATLILAKLIAVYPKGDQATAAVEALQEVKAALAKANEDHPPAPQSTAAKTAATSEAMAPVDPPRSPAKKAGPTEVVSLRHWSTDSYTRVVVETTAPVSFEGHLLKTNKDHPKRLYVDLTKCAIARNLQRPVPIKDGLLQQMRSAQFSPTTVRVVLDAQTIVDYKIFNLENPFRIIIDVKGSTNGKTALAHSGKKSAQSRNSAKTAGKGQYSAPLPSRGSPSLAQQLGLGIKRIVLDPGHGGKDPGAIGIGGLQEKDVVLNVAKKLAQKIRTRLGIEVVLTRTTDIFIPLEERTAIANTNNGDLFISIHANAAPNPQAQGIETYYLDFAGNEAARGLAAVENASSSRQISDLQNILSSLMLNSKKDESAKLAGTVQNTLVGGLCRSYPQIINHGVKTAPFIVLIGAQMPSILTEIAFISNPLEAQRLQNDKYLDELADHITEGVSSYSSSLTMARL